VEREAAVARLRVAGSRALHRLIALASSGTGTPARAAALRALEGIADDRALVAALQALDDGDSAVAAAAIGVLRSWLTQEAGTRALDALAAAALDRAREPRLRLAALDALSELPRDIVQPLLDAGSGEALPSEPGLDDAAAAHDWVVTHATHAPLSALHDLVADSRERERAARTEPERSRWLSVRGAAHAALARRGSRVALYDLREAFATASAPLPLDFLTAMMTIGDATCLEPLARTWSAAGDAWWRDRLHSTAAGIAERARLTGRSAILKRMRAKWPGFL
jgi:hypothetical protein